MAEPGQLRGRVLVTGAAGFIGGAVLEGLRRRGEVPVRLLLHRLSPPGPQPPSCQAVSADLARPGTLAGICEDVDAVIHAASYIGVDRELLEAVNARGTAALVAQARASRVRRFIYVSNAAVYGYAVHRGATEAETAVCPATAISRSRVRAELAGLENGGAVLRPLFVYGRGDTNFLPVMIKSLERFPFLVNGGRARLSVISAADLADVLVEMATAEGARTFQGVYHANDAHPISLGEIVQALAGTLGLRRPSSSLPFFIAWRILRLSGRGAFKMSDRQSFKHRLFLISKDHFYDSTRLWDAARVKPGPSLTEQLPNYADWYRRFSNAGRAMRPE